MKISVLISARNPDASRHGKTLWDGTPVVGGEEENEGKDERRPTEGEENRFRWLGTNLECIIVYIFKHFIII